MRGTILTREYKGQTVRVMVPNDGFEYLGEIALSAWNTVGHTVYRDPWCEAPSGC